MRGCAAVAPLCLLCFCLLAVLAVRVRGLERRGLERRGLGSSLAAGSLSSLSSLGSLSSLSSLSSLRTALSPERQGLRPGGALSGLPPALLEWPDRLHDPQPGDLNATLLRAKLGRHFDPRIMSVVRPQRRQHQHR